MAKFSMTAEELKQVEKFLVSKAKREDTGVQEDLHTVFVHFSKKGVPFPGIVSILEGLFQELAIPLEAQEEAKKMIQVKTTLWELWEFFEKI